VRPVFANAKPHASVPWRDGRYTYRWRNRDSDHFMNSNIRLATSRRASCSKTEPTSATSRLWRRRRSIAANRLPKAKNVTILGLPWLNRGLHIVYPKDSQRYYLLFTRIHKLFAPLFTSIRTLLKTSTLPHRHDSTKTRNSACFA